MNLRQSLLGKQDPFNKFLSYLFGRYWRPLLDPRCSDDESGGTVTVVPHSSIATIPKEGSLFNLSQISACSWIGSASIISCARAIEYL